MRPLLLLCALAALCLPSSALAGGVVSAFYYPWFGPTTQTGMNHWAQDGHDPPDDIASNYYPALGPYSSGSTDVVRQQMAEIAQAGIDEVAVSWWGWGSPEDERLPVVMAAAQRAGVAVAVQIEPYAGRTVASVYADIQHLSTLGIQTFYVYQAFVGNVPSAWAAPLDALRADGLTVFAQTGLVGQAVAGHFSGVYTYDIVTYGPRELGRFCAEAHAHQLLCAPSVGPGFDAKRATGDPRVLPRRDGATYDDMWRAAIAAGADRITITSFNEWQEGTQIEPASPPVRLGDVRYGSYNGSWGLEGPAASMAYLARTAYWTALFHALGRRPS
jgi:hypothetical protein